MGIISKGAKCNVADCKNDGVRSLNTSKVEMLGYVFQPQGKKLFFVKLIIRNGKKKQRRIDR